tara:strand:+ start:334 stop:780 length:447 start_codon:yes stop_codon:yes gene_type:complete
MKKILLISCLILFGCAPKTKTEFEFTERWIDYDDIEGIFVGMQFKDVKNILGEPLYTEHTIDSLDTASPLLITSYNFRTKLYVDMETEHRFDGTNLATIKPVRRAIKPKKSRPSNPPWGPKYVLKLYFENSSDKIIQNYQLKYWEISK